MDLALYGRILSRFRFLVIAGVLLATALAFASHMRVGLDGAWPTLSHRASATWESSATILVSERGFPAGVSLLEEPPAPDGQRDPEERVYSDPSRFEGLAVLYAKFAESDEVMSAVRRAGPVSGSYVAQPMKTDDGAHYLPFVLITATSSTPEEAQELARRATTAMRAYVARNQDENGIPVERRVEVPVINEANTATLVSGPSLVRPLVILLLGLVATFGLVFVLENLRPRPRSVAAPSPLPVAAPEARRAAQSR